MNPFDPKHRYKVTYEQSKAFVPRAEWPALEVIPCAKGGKGAHIFRHGVGLFGFTGVGMSWREALLGAGARAWQTGDQEFTVVFGEDVAQRIMGIVRPRVKKPGRSAAEMARIRLGGGPKTTLETTIGLSEGSRES